MKHFSGTCLGFHSFEQMQVEVGRVSMPSATDVAELRRERRVQQAKAHSINDLVRLATARGYKSPEKWAAHVWTGRQAKQERRAG